MAAREEPGQVPGAADERAAAPDASRPEQPAGARPGAETGDGPGASPSSGGVERPSGGTMPPRAGAPQAAQRGAAAPPASARGWLHGIGGGIVGGALVALLFYLVPQEAPGVAELRSELDQLRQSVSQLEQPPSADLLARLDALEGAVPRDQAARLQALEEQVAAIDTGAAGAAEQRVASLEREVADLASSVAGLQDAAPSAGAAGDQAVADLRARIDALEQRLDQADAAGRQIEQLTARLDGLEQQIDAGRAGTAGLGDQMTALSGRLGALSARVDALGETVEQVRQEIAATEDRRTQAAALALALTELDAAIEQGAPFEEQLDNLRGLDAADPALAEALEALAPAATSGVPTLPALRNAFAESANRIVNATRVPEGEGLLQQAAANLKSLVTVRPVGADVEGDDAAARVARAEAALDRGDLAAAVAEVEALEGGAARAAEPWLADARRRLAAEQALAGLQERTSALLAAQP
ncbi:MAG TPA: mitofilin family membrane protein [Geminicoccaceae bacterium]|nr:mitofilin family membrane protein [Geminicoccaceae bacterium]